MAVSGSGGGLLGEVERWLLGDCRYDCMPSFSGVRL